MASNSARAPRSDQRSLARASGHDEDIEVRRSARRKRTVTAFREEGRIVVVMPQRMTQAEQQRWVDEMVTKLLNRERRGRAPATDTELQSRARQLAERYLADQVGELRDPTSVVWVTNQRHRWGSCTPATGAIRLTNRLQKFPSWVVDYVLLHELCHLYEVEHSPRFWRLLSAYPETEKAKGYLIGWVDGQAARADIP